MATNNQNTPFPIRTNILFWLHVLFIIALLFSCSKDKGIVGPTGEKNSTLTFRVEGIKASTTKVPKVRSASVISGKALQRDTSNISASSNMQQGAGFTADVYAEQIQPGGTSRPVQYGAIMQVPTAAPLSTSKMKEGHTYRILLYEKTSGRLAGNVQAKAGTPISIEVYKGETYEVYAYSYNDSENIPEPDDPLNPSIPTSIHKDLLYAHPADVTVVADGTDNIPSIAVPLVFEHKVVQVSVRMDLTGLANYGDIVELGASFVQDNYLNEDNFNIKGGSLSGNSRVIETSLINLEKDSVSHIYEANFYTTDPRAAAAIKVRLDKLLIQLYHIDAANRQKDLASVSNPKPEFSYNFATPSYGERLIGTAKLLYKASTKLLLHVGMGDMHGNPMGFAMESSVAWKLLANPINFGNEENSIFRMEIDEGSENPWIDSNEDNNTGVYNHIEYTYDAPDPQEVIDRIDVPGYSDWPDIMITGEGFDITTKELADAMLQYIEDGGVIIMMMSRSNTNHLDYFLNKLFDLENSQYKFANQREGGNALVYPFILKTPDDRILNGPFGYINRSEPHWGNSDGAALGIRNDNWGPLPAISYALNKASNSAVNAFPAARTIFKHRDKAFFYIGSGYFTATRNTPSSIALSPFELHPQTGQPTFKSYGSAGLGHQAGHFLVYNSHFIANVMAWAVAAAELKGSRTRSRYTGITQ